MQIEGKPISSKLWPPPLSRLALPKSESVDVFASSSAPRELPPLFDLRPSFSPARRVDKEDIALAPMAGVPVQAVVQSFDGLNCYLGSEALKTLDVRFGKLEKIQFKALKNSFGGLSQVVFDPQRQYSAGDFLPPLAQGLLNQDLDIPEAVELPDSTRLDPNGNPMRTENKKALLTMNCHATAWQLARAYQGRPTPDVAVFFGDPLVMDDLIQEGADFQLLGKFAGGQETELAKLPMQPGDILQYFQVSDWASMTKIMHSAVYVGNGLYFDKPDTEGADQSEPERQNETPFRLVTLDMVSRTLYGDYPNYRMEVWRPTAPMKASEDAFEAKLEGPFRDYASQHGKRLNMEMVEETEFSSGGGILQIHANPVASVPLRQNPDGTTSLEGSSPGWLTIAGARPRR